MNCIKCGNIIPEARLKILPDAQHCVNCSTVQKKVGFQIIDSKTTYSELEIVGPDSTTAHDLSRMERKHFGANFMHKPGFESDIVLDINIEK